MKDTIKAYIVGLIDGEGCIAITRRKLKREIEIVRNSGENG